MLAKRLVLIVAFVCIVAGAAYSGVPPIISYQGRLTQPSGAPVADGTYSMLFCIYDVATGGTPLWSETNPSVQVNGGLFATMLGSVVNIPANIFDSPTRYFGVKVASDPEMTPRQQIASVGYALKAGAADLATTVPDGAITAQKLANGAVTTDKVSDGGITTAKMASGVATPAGTISMFGGSTAPTGWLLCDGTAVSRAVNANLFAAIGTTFGTGDGSTTFNVPDFRGVFPKGAGTTNRTAGKDATGHSYAGVRGTYSQDQMQGHIHPQDAQTRLNTYGPTSTMFVGAGSQWANSTYNGAPQSYVGAPCSDGTNGTPRAGLTTEPQSVGIAFIIKS